MKYLFFGTVAAGVILCQYHIEVRGLYCTLTVFDCMSVLCDAQCGCFPGICCQVKNMYLYHAVLA